MRAGPKWCLYCDLPTVQPIQLVQFPWKTPYFPLKEVKPAKMDTPGPSGPTSLKKSSRRGYRSSLFLSITIGPSQERRPPLLCLVLFVTTGTARYERDPSPRQRRRSPPPLPRRTHHAAERGAQPSGSRSPAPGRSRLDGLSTRRPHCGRPRLDKATRRAWLAAPSYFTIEK